MIITTTQEQVEVPGGQAERPTEIPARGWLQVAKRGWKEAKADQVPLLAAGVAFYAFLAIFPALIAVVTIYGLFADPSTIANQLNSMTAALPDEAKQIITDQVTALSSRRQALGVGLIISVVIALWSASAGISNLLTAVNVAYDEEEKRGFVKKRLMSLGLTLGAIVFMVIILALVAVLPPLLQAVFGTGALTLAPPDRWLACHGRARRYSAGGHLPSWAGPRRATYEVGICRRSGGHGDLADRLDRVLDLHGDVRQLRQDVRGLRGNRGAAVLALAHHVRDLARRRDQRRGRAADSRRHDQGPGGAAGRAGCCEGGLDSFRGSRGTAAGTLTWPCNVG